MSSNLAALRQEAAGSRTEDHHESPSPSEG